MEQQDIVRVFRCRHPLLSHACCCQIYVVDSESMPWSASFFHASTATRSPLNGVFSRVTSFAYRYAHDRAASTGVQSFLLCG